MCRHRLILAAVLVVAIIGGCSTEPPDNAEATTEAPSKKGSGPVTRVDGYATTDDGVQLYYEILGEGTQAVVIPMGLYLGEVLEPLAEDRRMIFYDPRCRGKSECSDLSVVSIDRQIRDLENLREELEIERMAIIGWSGLGMEMARYALRYPERVSRLVQVSPVPPSQAIMREEGDDRVERVDPQAREDLLSRFDAGEFDDTPAEFCELYNELTLPANFVDPTLVSRVPDVCTYENEWPANLWPYFGALLGSFGDYDLSGELEELEVPRLVIHGREDGIPLEGAYAWTRGYANARLVVLSPAGHFPFLERPDEFFLAVDEFLKGEWPGNAEIVE